MRKACLFVHRVYQCNEIFDPKSPLNRDNCLQFFHDLKKQFLNSGIDLQTQDLCLQKEAEFVIFNEVPKNISQVEYPNKSFVLLFESELIRPDDWNLKNHKRFKSIFTWHDGLVDNKKYFKFNFTHAGGKVFKRFNEKNKFCTLIAGNKRVRHPLELYSKRVEAIRWFEKFHPEDFEFYGIGWDLYTFDILVIGKYLNRIRPLRRMFTLNWPSYRGAVSNKLELLKNFKFSICYENASEIPGYITEKIFDSMAAGCIPIYWGAPNISEFVPKECYIDRAKFVSYEELYRFLKNMSEADYNSKLDAISKYLLSEKHKLFEPSYNAEIVVKRVVSAQN